MDKILNHIDKARSELRKALDLADEENDTVTGEEIDAVIEALDEMVDTLTSE